MPKKKEAIIEVDDSLLDDDEEDDEETNPKDLEVEIPDADDESAVSNDDEQAAAPDVEIEDEEEIDDEPDPEDVQPGDSEKFQRRIKKLTRKYRGAERQVQRLDVANRALAGTVQELGETIQAMDARMRKRERDDVESRIAALKQQRSHANQEGDVERAVEIEDQITELRMDQRVEREHDAARAQQADQQRQTRAAPTPDIPQETHDWVRRNAHWYNQPGYQGKSQMAIAIDNALSAEGIPPTDPRHYRELDRRLKSMYPDDDDDDLDDDPQPRKSVPRKRSAPRVAPASRSSSATAGTKRNVVRLTAGDMAYAREIGKENDKAYLERLAIERREFDKNKAARQR